MIDAAKVEEIFKDCLFKKDEIGDDGKPKGEMIEIEGITNRFGFHPDRVKTHESEIIEFLRELPEQFHQNSGGGWSFLNLCNTKNGEQWTGFHLRMEQLVCLGMAIGKVEYCLPRKAWPALPGGMPYVVIDLGGGK